MAADEGDCCEWIEVVIRKDVVPVLQYVLDPFLIPLGHLLLFFYLIRNLYHLLLEPRRQLVTGLAFESFFFFEGACMLAPVPADNYLGDRVLYVEHS